MHNNNAALELRQCNKFMIVVGIVMVMSLFFVSKLSAAPELHQIATGDVNISAQPQHLNIQQNSPQAILDWHSFNVSAQESVHFQQPINGVCLNRIDAASGMSQIAGHLSATSKIILINEAGILFGETAKVNVGGIIASSIGITENNFVQGNYKFDLPSTTVGAIVNRGSIKIEDHGLAALLGASVANDGIIQANMSNVILACGNKFTLDFFDDGIINFAVDEATLTGGVKVSGRIANNGGDILITGKAARDLFDNLINVDGVVRATSVMERNGSIVLLGDSEGVVQVTGELDASSFDVNSNGGSVHVLGQKVIIDAQARILVAGQNGGGEILIGGDYKGSNSQIKNADTIYIGPDVILNADAITMGDGGKIINWSDFETKFLGKAYARGGAENGNGGFLEISSGNNLLYAESAHLDLSATNGMLGNVLFDPRYLVVSSSGSGYTSGTNNLYANNVGATNTLTPNSIVTAGLLASITLQANTDVVFSSALNITTLGSSLTVNAGRSVIVNANISTTNTAITITANDTGSTSSDRNTTSTGNPTGDTETTLGNITMAAATSISSGSGALSMTIGSSNSAPYSPGSINVVALTGGAITLTSPNAVNGTGAIAVGTSLTISEGAASSISGVISGAGTLTLASTSTDTLTLNNTNTYTGSTTINGGNLSISADNNLGAAPGGATTNFLNFGGGTLETTASFTLSSNRGVTLNSGGGTFQVDPTFTTAYNGIAAGTGTLTKTGTGILTLGGANIYSGETTINAGTISISADNNLGTAPGSATAGQLAFGTGTLVTTATFTLNANRGIATGTSTTISPNIGTTLTYDGIMAGSGTVNISGVGTLILSGANIYTGATNVNSGILQTNAVNSIQHTSALMMSTTTTAEFNLNNNSQIVGSLSGGSSATVGDITLGSGTLTVNQTASGSYGGVMSGTGGLTLSGSSTNTLTLTAANTYSGITTITAGTLSISADNNLGASPGSTTPGQLTFGSGTLDTTATFTLNSNRGIASGTSTTFAPSTGTTLTYNGIMAGSGTVTMSGAGTLTLGGASTYSGATTISIGTISIDADNNLGTAPGSATIGQLTFGTGTLITTATFTLNVNRGIATGTNTTFAPSIGTTLTYNGTMAGSGTLTVSSGGTLILGGANTYSGATTISGSIISISADNNLGTAPGIATPGSLTISGGILTTTATFTLDSKRGISMTGTGATISPATGTALTYNGIMAGGGTLTMAGAGTLTLGGANTYTAATTISTGTISINADNNLGAAPGIATPGQLTFGSGTLITTATFSLNSNRGIATGTSASFAPSTATTLNYSGIMAGSGTVTMSGAGILTLGGANTYSGATTISTGTLNISADDNLGSAPGSTTPGLLTFGSGTLVTTATFTLNSNRGITTGTSATFAPSTATALNYSGIMAGSGTVTMSGAGTLTLGGSNTYSGATTISTGTLNISSDNNLGTPPGSATTNYLNFNAGTLVSTAIFSLNANRGVTLNSGGGTLQPNTGTTLTYNGIIAGTGGLTTSGLGIVTLGGANTYSGSTSINAGTLQISADNNLGTAPGSATANSLNFSGGTLETTATLAINANRGITLNSGGGTTQVDPTFTATYNGIMVGTGAFSKSGSGTLILGGTNTYTGATNVTAGTMRAGVANTITSSSALTMSNVVGAIFDANSLTQTVGTLSGGGSNGGNISLGSGALTITQTATGNYAGVISGTGSLTKAGSGMLTLGVVQTYSGATSINAGTLQAGVVNVIPNSSSVMMANTAGAIFDLNNLSQAINILSGGGSTGGNITLGSATLTVNQGSNNTYSGVVSGTGGLTKAGSAILTLGSANSYSGATAINAGTLQAGVANVIASSSSLTLVNTASAIFDLNNFTQSIGTLSGGGAIGGNITLGSGTLTVTQGSNAAFSGVISGTGGLTKAGISTLTLNTATTYSGVTTINAGSLQAGVTNAIANSSALTLANIAGATFDLNNLSQSVSSISGGGTTGGNITLGAGTLTANQAASGTYSGIISGAGGINKTGAATLTLNNANSYNGATNVNVGILSIANASGLGGSSGVTTLSGATLNIAISSAALANTNTITTHGTGVSGNGAITLTGSSITINNPIVLASTSNIGGTASGSIAFNGTISGNHDLSITLSSANLNFSALNVGGTATLTSNNATGTINVGGLALNTNLCNLTGFVAGENGDPGARLIQVLNTIYMGTHYFDGVDLSDIPPPPLTVADITRMYSARLQSVFAVLFFNYSNDYGNDDFSSSNNNNSSASIYDTPFSEEVFISTITPESGCTLEGGIVENCM